MLTDAKKLENLRMAIALMMDADALIQTALGDTDSYQFTQMEIENVIEDLRADVMDLEARVEGIVP